MLYRWYDETRHIKWRRAVLDKCRRRRERSMCEGVLEMWEELVHECKQRKVIVTKYVVLVRSPDAAALQVRPHGPPLAPGGTIGPALSGRAVCRLPALAPPLPQPA